MKCLDSSFLIDYLNGEQATLTYLSENDDFPLYVPAVALYEIYEGRFETTVTNRKRRDRTSTGSTMYSRSPKRLHWKPHASSGNY